MKAILDSKYFLVASNDEIKTTFKLTLLKIQPKSKDSESPIKMINDGIKELA